jgi:hypothetical protein
MCRLDEFCQARRGGENFRSEELLITPRSQRALEHFENASCTAYAVSGASEQSAKGSARKLLIPRSRAAESKNNHSWVRNDLAVIRRFLSEYLFCLKEAAAERLDA